MRKNSHERSSIIHSFFRNSISSSYLTFDDVSSDVIDRVSRAFFDVNRLADTMLATGRDFYNSNARIVRFLNRLPLADRLRVLDRTEFEDFAKHRRGLMAELETGLRLD